MKPIAVCLLMAVLTARAGAVTFFPASEAKDVCPDTPLKIFFEAPVTLGSGKIQIVDAADGMVVETFDVSAKTATKSIGGQANYTYYPMIVTGSEVALYPRNNELGYGKTYTVVAEAGAFKDLGEQRWRFSTRVVPPAAGTRRLIVAADGTGMFCTVQGALDFIPEGNKEPTTLFLKAGTYTEMIFLANKHAITILGEDRRKSVIAYADNNNFNNATGTYHRGVFLAQRVNDLALVNLTIRNTTPQGGSQAEAIILNGTPTAHAIVANVDLYSFQDTLQINGQAYITDSYIEGDVDFMWGTGPCFFENCHAKSLRSNAYYTQIRNTAANHGYVYHRCLFDGAEGVTGNFLSRIAPVRFPASEVVLMDCTMSAAVGGVAWRLDPVAPAPAGRGAATAPAVATDLIAAAGGVRFWEYNSHDIAGKPVDVSKRLGISRQLKLPEDAEAVGHYSDAAWVLGGWVPTLAPIITSEPRVNGAGRLGVEAIAVPTPAFQWQRDGVDMAGATGAEISVDGGAGIYRVIVSNSAGKVTSRAVRVSAGN